MASKSLRGSKLSHALDQRHHQRLQLKHHHRQQFASVTAKFGHSCSASVGKLSLSIQSQIISDPKAAVFPSFIRVCCNTFCPTIPFRGAKIFPKSFLLQGQLQGKRQWRQHNAVQQNRQHLAECPTKLCLRGYAERKMFRFWFAFGLCLGGHLNVLPVNWVRRVELLVETCYKLLLAREYKSENQTSKK